MIVELRVSFAKVRSSWLAVHTAAMELNEACETVRNAPGLGFAYTFIDDLSAMMITLKGAGNQVGDGVGDATATS